MAYRDERETLERRVRVLEAELADAQETILRLQGQRIELTHEHEPADPWTGSPRRVRLERTLPFTVDAATLSAIEELFRARLHDARSRTSQVGTGLRHHWAEYEVTVTVADGETRVVAEADYGQARLGLLLGGGLGFPVLGMPVVAGAWTGIVTLFGLGTPTATALGVVLAVMAIGAGMLLYRALHRRHVRVSRERVAGVMEAIPLIAERQRLRIADEQEAEAEVEALANEAEVVAPLRTSR